MCCWCIPSGMPDPAAPSPIPKRGKDPSFGKVVVASAIILLIFIIGAWLVVKNWGRHLTPPVKPNPEPHSMLVMPAPERTPVTLA